MSVLHAVPALSPLWLVALVIVAAIAARPPRGSARRIDSLDAVPTVEGAQSEAEAALARALVARLDALPDLRPGDVRPLAIDDPIALHPLVVFVGYDVGARRYRVKGWPDAGQEWVDVRHDAVAAAITLTR